MNSAHSNPWYESNLLWGSVGIVITVIASSKHDLRWLFLIAWPCLGVPMWSLASRTRWVWPAAVGGVVLIGAGLLALGIWLKPSNVSIATNPQPSPAQPATPIAGAAKQPATPVPVPRNLHHKTPPKTAQEVTQDGTFNNQTVIQGRAVVQQNSTGDCSPNIIGSGNTNNCNEQPKISASHQQQKATGNPAMPWVVEFSISTSALTQTGDLRLKCSGPALLAAISRINPMEFISGSNGPLKDDPNTVVYELGPEMLSPGKWVSIAVYSQQPVTVLSGTIGLNRIIF
jgi:hypothetical protein